MGPLEAYWGSWVGDVIPTWTVIGMTWSEVVQGCPSGTDRAWSLVRHGEWYCCVIHRKR